MYMHTHKNKGEFGNFKADVKNFSLDKCLSLLFSWGPYGFNFSQCFDQDSEGSCNVCHLALQC